MVVVYIASTCAVSYLPSWTFMDYGLLLSADQFLLSFVAWTTVVRTLYPISCSDRCLLRLFVASYEAVLLCSLFVTATDNVNCASRQQLFCSSCALSSGVLCDLIIVFRNFWMGTTEDNLNKDCDRLQASLRNYYCNSIFYSKQLSKEIFGF